MLMVVCTLVLVDGTGYRHVHHHVEGVEVQEQAPTKEHWKRPTGDYIRVDFSRSRDVQVPTPVVRWVRANDCQYVGDPVRGYEELLEMQDLEKQRQEEAKRAWGQVSRRILKQNKNRGGKNAK